MISIGFQFSWTYLDIGCYPFQAAGRAHVIVLPLKIVIWYIYRKLDSVTMSKSWHQIFVLIFSGGFWKMDHLVMRPGS